MWAIPGGMVDAGEHIGQTLRREFMEEAMQHLQQMPKELETFFDSGGEQIYAGYVDDQRNTDNAWMETVACNFHDESGDALDACKLEAGDDAVAVRWIDLASDVVLTANHGFIVSKVVERLQAHW